MRSIDAVYGLLCRPLEMRHVLIVISPSPFSLGGPSPAIRDGDDTSAFWFQDTPIKNIERTSPGQVQPAEIIQARGRECGRYTVNFAAPFQSPPSGFRWPPSWRAWRPWAADRGGPERRR